ncbi:MAG: hypothetical protein KDD62_06330, partial [Bdellovibrionales bacterium]|nr:hypothetical protein [Bdellovibrionales bacterium]
NLNPLAQDQPKPSASPRPQPKLEPASAVTIFKIDEKTEQALHNFFVSQLKRINKALGNRGRDVEVMMQKVTAQTDIKVYYKFEALLKDFEANPQASSDEPTTKYGDTVQAIMSGQRGTDDLRTFIAKLFSQQLSSGVMSLFDGKEQKLVKAFYAKLKESQGN